jgi:hypothetical protein
MPTIPASTHSTSARFSDPLNCTLATNASV